MQARQLLISAAAILIVGAAQAAEDMPTVSGFVGIYSGGTSFNHPDEEDSVEGVAGGEAAINLWLSPMWSAQVDVQGEWTTEFDDSSFDDHSRTFVSVAGHLTHRNPSSYAVGVFGGFAHNGVLDGSDEQEYMHRWAAGAELQVYLDNVTLYLQGGYSMLGGGNDNHGEPVDGPFGRVAARLFPTSNDKIQAEFAYFYAHDVETGNQGPVHDYEWGASYEHMFGSAPVSAFLKYAGYSYNDLSHPSDNSWEEHMVLIGFKVYLNQQDLKSNDRQGATLETPVWRGMSFLSH